MHAFRLGLRCCGQALVILRVDVSFVTAGQRGLLVVAQVDVGPLVWIAGFDRYSAMNVRRVD